MRIPWLIALGWIGLTIFTVGIGILLYTRWGQYRPLRKCMVLSLLAHLVLATYAATVRTVAHPAPPDEPVIRVSLIDPSDHSGRDSAAQAAAFEPARPRAPDLLAVGDKPPRRERAGSRGAKPVASLEPPVPLPETFPGAGNSPIAEAPRQNKSISSGDAGVKPTAKDAGEKPAPRMRNSPGFSDATAKDAGKMPAPLADAGKMPALLADAGKIPAPLADAGKMPAPLADAGATPAAQGAMPASYRLRMAADRAGVLRRHGGNAETEAAVRAALRWLADNQAADGRWDPRSQGAGRETSVQGQDRRGAGTHADAAMTGLALLAFLGSGHTHLEGAYRENVRRGLAYLMENQAADGNLADRAAGYEVMYCHGMAACALSEAFGMTRDARLREPVRRAVGYTVAAQDAVGGGWRYRPAQAGDTSQLGWQVMSLRSADLAGIPMPAETRQGILRYLQSVCSGTAGGLASYQPGLMPSRSMTAEALVCWQLLGLPQDHPAAQEAAAYLLGETPGDECNLYYWYYATLGMYQMQGPGWQTWNDAVQRALLRRQVKQGPLAGSWETDDLWAGYGGRLYTTSLAALTLEVYYRFLPLYAAAAQDGLTRRK